MAEQHQTPGAILGRPVRAALRTPALAEWFREHWHHPAHAPSAHPFTVDLKELEPPVAVQMTGAPTVTAMPGFRLEWWRAGEDWHAGGPAAGVRLRLMNDGAEIHAWCATGRSDAVRGALYMATCEALRASGLLPLHAAVAVPPGGDAAIALVGASGAGKSTTLLRLAAAGWTPLAEDLSWLDPADGMLYGWDRGVRLWPGTADTFAPWLADAAWREEADGKRFLPWSALGAPERRAAPLAALAVLERDSTAASVWERLTPRDAVRLLWEATGVPLSPQGRRAAESAAARSLARVSPWRLRLGTGAIPPWPTDFSPVL